MHLMIMIAIFGYLRASSAEDVKLCIAE